MPATPEPILVTKLRPPRRRRTMLARPRLAEPHGRRAQHALTLVSAPAGFGKTTLAADRFAGDRAAAWLSLDARDDDPVRFWTYLIAALDVAAPELRSGAGSLLRTPGAPLAAVVSTLINDLETAAQDLVLVLDDYHLVTSQEIHESVAFLLEHMPPQLRLVLVTRADPPLPLAALRAAGDLLEIRASALRFTAEEAGAYFRDVVELDLTAEEVEALDTRTEGWIAALQLAGISMRGRNDPSAFIADFAGDDSFILDYLTDEVLERQHAEVREFLLLTSILGRLNPALCAAVTGAPGQAGGAAARAMLEHLERSNLFLVPLDDRRAWYRYHHLFGDVLRARLLAEQADRVPDLHRRASDWYETNHQPEDAIAHALAGDDPARAARLIELAAQGMQQARRETELRGWLEALPAVTYSDRPVLAMALIGARMATGDTSGLDPLFAIVDRWLHEDARDEHPVVFDDVARRRLPAMAAVHRAGLALLAGDTAATIGHAERALALTGPDDLLQRGAAAALIGLAHWHHVDLEMAQRGYVESIACFEAGGYLADVMGCSLALADIQLTQGRLRDAQRTFEAALRHTVTNPALRGAADMHVGLALLAVEHDDLDAAARHLDAAAELGEDLGLPQHPYRVRVALARVHEANGDLRSAAAHLDEAAARYTTDFLPSVRPVHAMRARVSALLGDHEVVAQWATRHELAIDDHLTSVREFEHLTLARTLLAGGSPDAIDHAASLLRRLLAAAEAGGRDGSAIEILVALASAEQAAGRRAAACDAIADALARAEGEGQVRTFLDAGTGVTHLLRSLDGDAGRRAARVLASSPDAARVSAPRARPADPDALSDRELEVLRLLCGDLTGPDIARALYVSLNTLRTHTKHIYTKLGATNRREAVTRARELGI